MGSREIKQGAKYAEHADGENKGRMKILKMRKQSRLLRWESRGTAVMNKAEGKAQS